MAKRLDFTEFMEFVLARVYELDETVGSGGFHDVHEIAAELAEPVPKNWPADVVAALQDRGLVSGYRAFGGDVGATLTGEGRLFVEQLAREKDSIVHEYRHSPSNIVIVHGGSGHNIAFGNVGYVTQTSISGDVRDEVTALLRQIEETLLADESLDGAEREDALADVRAAQGQMEKREPNRQAVLALLGPLSKIASVGAFVLKIGELLATG